MDQLELQRQAIQANDQSPRQDAAALQRPDPASNSKQPTGRFTESKMSNAGIAVGGTNLYAGGVAQLRETKDP